MFYLFFSAELFLLEFDADARNKFLFLSKTAL